MGLFVSFIAIIIIICILLNTASNKIGMPVLLAFIVLGIFFGNNGLIPIKFEDYSFAEEVSTVALIFIMFYGGFGTRWQAAKSAAVPAGLLASLGVILTAGLTGLFCHFVLGWGWVEGFLMGSVISSTDAASVFSILRSRKLGLKNNTAPLLEIESGSNDPFSYMLTCIMLTLLDGSVSGGQLAWMIFAQLAFGAGFGVLIAKLSIFAYRKINFSTSGFDSLFIFAIALASYGLPSLVGGNGYLSAYIVGIILGNAEIQGKKNLVNFFDGVTGLMQVVIFFMLGLLARPAMMHKVILPALGIFIFMLVIARPITVSGILAPFRKYPFKQQLCVSFGGLRGASSIVFAIMATVSGGSTISNDILNVVFCIVLLSISIQGFALPIVSKKLDMIDEDADVMKTFNDFSEETDLHFSQILINDGNPWLDCMVKDIVIPKNILFCMIIHPDGSSIVPNGQTVLRKGDTVIMCTQAFRSEQAIKLIEREIIQDGPWDGKPLRECSSGREQIVMIRRQGKNIIPNGNTIVKAGDTLFINLGR